MIKAPVNTIYVIESLSVDEKATGTELYNDIIKRYAEYHANGNEVHHQIFKVENKDQFLEAIRFIKHNAEYLNKGVLIHVETHGLGDKTGLYMSNGTTVSWEELKPELIAINVALENELYVTMATCYGRYLHEVIDITKQSPFSGFISASKEISENEILEDYAPFFEELVRTRDILEAEKILDTKGSNFYYKDVETVYNDLILDWLKKMREDPQFRKKFTDQCREDYDRVKEDWFPEFDQMPFEEVLELVKKDFVVRYRRNFLFGKGR